MNTQGFAYFAWSRERKHAYMRPLAHLGPWWVVYPDAPAKQWPPLHEWQRLQDNEPYDWVIRSRRVAVLSDPFALESESHAGNER